MPYATYSQKQERAADDYGYEFLKKAGKNPWAMALSFQKLKKLQEEAGAKKSSKLNQLFSTHPDLDARIQRMEERATSEGIEKPANTMGETGK
jgi:metalloprotease